MQNDPGTPSPWSKMEEEEMKFTKMQGLGNDYLYFYEEVPENVEELAVRLSNRYFGPGSDGLIYICKSEIADYKMRIFNADGSEAKMCGNGIRCVGKYVYDKGYTKKTVLQIETLSGIKILNLHLKDGKVDEVTVDMGIGEVGTQGTLAIGTPEGNPEGDTTYLPISTGNPHAVIFVEDMEKIPLELVGPKVEKHPDFPGGVNAEFCQVLSGKELRMRVWERGSGITMACGTGTCATVLAAITRGFCPRDEEITVHLDGGDLSIRVDDKNRIFMTGPAAFVYEGSIEE